MPSSLLPGLSALLPTIQNLLNIVGAAEEHGKSVEKVKAIHDRIKEIWRLKLTPLSSQEDPDEDE